MNLSEQQAKEVLDFLIHKTNPDLRCSLIERMVTDDTIAHYILEVEMEIDVTTPFMHKKKQLFRVSYARRKNTNMLCQTCKNSYRSMLETIVNDASQEDIVYFMHGIENKIVPRMTSIEQILLDMDMSKMLS